MQVFLTSSPCADAPEGVDVPFVLDERNEFVANLQKYVRVGCKCLMVCAAPDMFAHNDRMVREFRAGFAYHGLVFEDMVMCDARNEEQLGELIAESGMIILAGGHLPTQHEFLQRTVMREKMAGFDGVVMGISAGTMSCADVVYVQPEEEGESAPEFERFRPGLGLAQANVLPHYQKVKDWWLDGKRLYEDITYADSMGHTFWVLPDGSYILCEDGRETIYGEAYRLQDGVMTPVCGQEERWEIR